MRLAKPPAKITALIVIIVCHSPLIQVLCTASLFILKEMIMKCHRLNEVLELLQPYWSKKDPEMSLMQILQSIADEAGFDKPLTELSDEVIIYQLKMRDADKLEPIPGIKKDYEEDFKTALLKARGIIK